MVDSKVLSFFKNGGVFLLDEEDYANEDSYELVYDLMGDVEGENIYEVEIDIENGLYLYYDASVMSEVDAIRLFEKGKYKKKL